MKSSKEPNVDGYCDKSVYVDGEHICQITGKGCTSLNGNGIPNQYECRRHYSDLEHSDVHEF